MDTPHTPDLVEMLRARAAAPRHRRPRYPEGRPRLPPPRSALSAGAAGLPARRRRGEGAGERADGGGALTGQPGRAGHLTPGPSPISRPPDPRERGELWQ